MNLATVFAKMEYPARENPISEVSKMEKGKNIFKRKDGRWEARYVRERELSGKIKYGFCYGKTYRVAKEKVTRLKADLADGKLPTTYNTRQRFSGCMMPTPMAESVLKS
jgi:hypothetical protein